jgi:hypothetical protein
MCDVDPEGGLTPPNGSIFTQLDRFCRTLAYASPAFNTILRVGRIGFVSFDFINFAGTDLGTIPATTAFFLIDDRIHGYFKFQISNYKSQSKNHAHRTGLPGKVISFYIVPPWSGLIDLTPPIPFWRDGARSGQKSVA